MKKLLLFVFAVVLLCGCAEHNKSFDISEDDIIEIDGCEYIKKRFKVPVHKGNCKYCQQRNKDMVIEVVDSIVRTYINK